MICIPLDMLKFYGFKDETNLVGISRGYAVTLANFLVFSIHGLFGKSHALLDLLNLLKTCIMLLLSCRYNFSPPIANSVLVCVPGRRM